ncbi:hypothetical protein L579_1785 [Pantoea sp. AS-PWVM4]|uniref:DUF1418 domain-containing protein n=1 Tax=Pantoea phytobeneficialis TaxID=2052056 RepID=A0AAP9KNN3_9GAMM|nr:MULTISPECIES: DUF1418 family protein [Pantoea]ERK18461.1 hypothetical protein L579_1785 [Pantoea sp. AS-PWVM4]MDO6406416.1 DUF1418 family protein [Pantoea phytobeneficialis]QGR06101.1 DUF1418 domain-containing protein [Pantoea phytobeneficialis]
MSNLARLPKPVLLLEAIGVIAVIGALALINDWIAAPAAISEKTLATVLFIVGIVLMLPAAWLMMWRTAKAMAPQLFNQHDKKK